MPISEPTAVFFHPVMTVIWRSRRRRCARKARAYNPINQQRRYIRRRTDLHRRRATIRCIAATCAALVRDFVKH